MIQSNAIVILQPTELQTLIKEAVSDALASFSSTHSGEKPKEFLTSSEAAKMIGLTDNALRIQRTQRRGIPFIKSGKRVLYRYQDIIDHMEANCVKTLS